MRAIVGMIFVTAVLVGLFAFIKFMVYGVSEDFGWGFGIGAVLMLVILLPYFHFEEKARERRHREELASAHRLTDL